MPGPGAERTAELVDTGVFADVEQLGNEPDGVVVSGLIDGCPVGVATLGADAWPLLVYARRPFDASLLADAFDDGWVRRAVLSQLRVILAAYDGQHLFLDGGKRPTGRFEDCRHLELDTRIYEDGMAQQRLMDRLRRTVSVAEAAFDLGPIARDDLIGDLR